MNKKILYKRALVTWGRQFQYIMCIEEMGELTQALTKSIRKGYVRNRLNIIEEIADVQIMLEQLIEIYGCKKDVDKVKIDKLKRLEKLLYD